MNAVDTREEGERPARFRGQRPLCLSGSLTSDPELRGVVPGHLGLRALRSYRGRRKNSATGGDAGIGEADTASTGSGLAEYVARNLVKGNKVAVGGRLQWREWETQDGEGASGAGGAQTCMPVPKGTTPEPAPEYAGVTSGTGDEDMPSGPARGGPREASNGDRGVAYRGSVFSGRRQTRRVERARETTAVTGGPSGRGKTWERPPLSDPLQEATDELCRWAAQRAWGRNPGEVLRETLRTAAEYNAKQLGLVSYYARSAPEGFATVYAHELALLAQFAITAATTRRVEPADGATDELDVLLSTMDEMWMDLADALWLRVRQPQAPLRVEEPAVRGEITTLLTSYAERVAEVAATLGETGCSAGARRELVDLASDVLVGAERLALVGGLLELKMTWSGVAMRPWPGMRKTWIEPDQEVYWPSPRSSRSRDGDWRPW